MKVLFVGDVVGKPGRAGLARAMPGLRERHAPDLVIVNGENSAGGLGITQKTAEDLFAMGADVITLGNHAYRHRDVFDYLDAHRPRRPPVELHDRQPGPRATRSSRSPGMRVSVINLIGQVQLRAARSPFAEAESLLDRLEGRRRRHLRRLPRRGHLGEGGDGLASRRPRRRRRRHPHARPDRRRAGAAAGAPRSSPTSA